MAVQFTPQQQKVIDLHERNILVSAAAGSGKTAVLVERIIQMICDEEHPVDIDRLLVVTFTNAAASEMRERISLGITRQLALHPESEHIQKQATLLHNAQITTIDSFCMFLLRNHFNEIGVDPAFRVMDEGEKKLLAQDVMRELMEDGFAGRLKAGAQDQASYDDEEYNELKDSDEPAPADNREFTDCVEYFCPGGREQVLEGYIQSLYEYAESYPWPEEWLNERKMDYAAGDVEGFEETDFGIYLKKHLHSMIEGCAETYERLQTLCQEPDGPYMYGELVDKEMDQITHLLALKTLEEYGRWLPAVTFGRLSAKKDETVSPKKRELAKSLRERVKKILSDLSSRFFTTPLALAAAQAGECAGPVQTLIELTLEYRRRLQEKKQEKKLVDFSDVEHYALDILLRRDEEGMHPSQVALEYRQHFVEILIDEYQDSNLVQEYLLRAVSGEEDGNYNRFMVGDVKQSIYKFRLARPELFLEKYENYTEKDSTCQRIDLSRNFRSRPEVVDTVNAIFKGIMSRQIGGIEYDDRAALYAGASYPDNPDCKSELLLVEKPGKDDKDLTAKQAEAFAIASRIKELKASFQVTDKESGELRPVQYRDMVILLRTNSGWDEEFKEILEEEGIPAFITSKTGYFGASEIQELLQLLRVLDNPRQEIPLFGVMKSMFGGFSEEEIALIRSKDREHCLIEVLEKLKSEPTRSVEDENQIVGDEKKERFALPQALQQKIADFLARIDHYRGLTVYMPIRELLQQIVNDTGYLDFVTALPAGSKRRANVEMLFAKASDFEKTSYHGLFHFVRYMEQLEKYDVDYGEAELLDENADVVRIMSIHKSKGLEFPVTFVSGLSKRFNMQDANQSLIVDMDLGLGADYVDAHRRIRNKTLRRLTLARKMKEDNLSEELRVLYVALTRPKEKLIMTATLENAGEKWEAFRELGTKHLSYPDFMESGSCLDFLLPVVGDASVNVQIIDPTVFSSGHNREQVQLMEKQRALSSAADYVEKEELAKLKMRFAWQYPLEGLKNLYTKTTVSELKLAAMADKDEEAYHIFEEKEIVPYIPRFMREQEAASGAAYGNAFHKVMELLDFGAIYQGIFPNCPKNVEEFRRGLPGYISVRNNDSTEENPGFERSDTRRQAVARLYCNLREQLAGEVEKKHLSAEYRQTVNDHKLVHFLMSELAFRMWRAQEGGVLFREQPFVYGVSAKRLGEDYPEEEKVLIQGIVDAYFIEDDQLVLVDYKTDVIQTPQELWNRYETQLQYYEEALCKLMKRPMKERILYSFYLEQCV